MPAIAYLQVISSGDMSAATVTSLPTDIKGMRDCSYQMTWLSTSSPIGTFTVEVSNSWVPTDPKDQATGSGTWTTLTLDRQPTQPSGGAGDTAIDLSGIPYRWVRLKYTKTSGGSATLNAWFAGKSAS